VSRRTPTPVTQWSLISETNSSDATGHDAYPTGTSTKSASAAHLAMFAAISESS